MSTVVLGPVYKNEFYQYHRCSECNGEINLEDKYGFEKDYKYCPLCGGEIIRFGQPIYEEIPNFEWLDEYSEVIDKAYRNLEYIIHCKKSKEERDELIEKTEFGEKYFGTDWYPASNGNNCRMLNYIARHKLHYTTKQKLEKEFGEVANDK